MNVLNRAADRLRGFAISYYNFSIRFETCGLCPVWLFFQEI